METNVKNNPGNDKELSHSDTEFEKSGSPVKTEEKNSIVFDTFQEATRLYFSSPCMLSEMEDGDDFLNR